MLLAGQWHTRGALKLTWKEWAQTAECEVYPEAEVEAEDTGYEMADNARDNGDKEDVLRRVA